MFSNVKKGTRAVPFFFSYCNGQSIVFWGPESQSAFLALFCKLLFAFFGLNENVVRIAQMLFPALPYFSVAAPVVKLKLMQVFKKLLIEFRLQLLGETREKFGCFRFEQPDFLKGLKVLDDSSKGHVER